MTEEKPVSQSRAKRESRSRKGCPECRRRKIKCDEKSPECGQCLKAGRQCQIIDSIFRPSSLSIVADTSRQATESRRFDSSEKEKPSSTSTEYTKDSQRPDSATASVASHQSESCLVLPEIRKVIPRRFSGVQAADPVTGTTSPSLETPTYSDFSQKSTDTGFAHSRQHSYDTVNVPTNRVSSFRPLSPLDADQTHGDETYQDRCEIAFFLRHFCEGPGRWMDVCGINSYFSQNAILLAHWSPLVRYAACALGAKQLGQTRHPEKHIRQTNTQSLMLKALIDTNLGFTWYGAKYYEKAIRLLAKELSSNEKLTQSLSPSCLYASGLTVQGHRVDNHNEDRTFQVLAACILCQYEDVNATIRAWSGHLDGIFRLFLPLEQVEESFYICKRIPQPDRGVDAVFWFAVVNDMLNSFVTGQKTRVDLDDIPLWCEMGLPIDGDGNLLPSTFRDLEMDVVLFKELVRLMCELVSSDLRDREQWFDLTKAFDIWQKSVPESFYVPITWPTVESDPATTDPFARETWFANDISAITLAFYHMARMILLENRPRQILFTQEMESRHTHYTKIQHDLRPHVMEIIPIMNAMPSEFVRKYMLQPLYVAGRCFTDDKEQRRVLQMLQSMSDDFGLFTDYRIRDLCKKWGVQYDGIDRRDGYGILT